MPRLTVTDRAYEMLLRYAQRELKATARRQHDGYYDIEISDELHAFLMGLRFLDESVSQTILRILPTWTGGRR